MKKLNKKQREEAFKKIANERLVLPVVIEKTTKQKRITIPKKSTIGDKGYVEVKDYE
jgi:ribonuclease HII